MSDNTNLAARLFAATSSGDAETLRAICVEDFAMRQNGGPTVGFAELAGLGEAVRRVAPDFRYENAVRTDTGHGFVEEHDACGTLADGTTFRLAACVVATVSNGRITAAHEYFDSVEARELMAGRSASKVAVTEVSEVAS